MQRRTFLIGSMAAAGATARVWGRQSGRGTSSAPAATLDRIAIMAYSFVRILKVPGQATSPERTLDVLDLPEMFADRYKVHNIEMQHNYFESTEASFFKTFLDRLAKSKSRISNINLELGNMNIA